MDDPVPLWQRLCESSGLCTVPAAEGGRPQEIRYGSQVMHELPGAYPLHSQVPLNTGLQVVWRPPQYDATYSR